VVSNRLLARIARQGGGKLLNLAVGRLLPVEKEVKKVPLHKRSLTKGLAGAAITKIATRSVPGAIVVGGGLIAKALYDRRHKPKSAAELDSGKDA
jgi:hypothetical protein